MSEPATRELETLVDGLHREILRSIASCGENPPTAHLYHDLPGILYRVGILAHMDLKGPVRVCSDAEIAAYQRGYAYGASADRPASREDFRKGYEKGWEAAREADAETVGDDIQPEAAELVPHECRATFEDFLLAVPRGGTFTYTAPPECPDEEADPC